MALALGFSIFTILFSYMVPTALLCIVQYFLSRMESPWPGRVLPILSGTVAGVVFLFLICNAASFVQADRMAVLLLLAVIFPCIPTAAFIIIYRRTRRNLVAKKNMEKMSIQDLE